MEAVRYGDRPDVQAKLEQVIDATVSQDIPELIRREALASEVISEAEVGRLRLLMEEAAARRLQPHYVASFFEKGLTAFGGRLVERETDRFEVTHVPAELRSRASTRGRPVARRYERVCFDKDLVHVPNRPDAQLVAPGHPLLDAVVGLAIERYGGSLTQGAVLVDEGDPSEVPRVLLYLDHSVTDARPGPGGQGHVVSRRFEFVTVDRTGVAAPGGVAPYLDYRPAREDELAVLKPLMMEGWLAGGELEGRALDYAVEELVPAHLAELSARTQERVDRTIAAVRARLTRERNYWDGRAAELAEQAAAGRQPRMNPERAQARAEELDRRLKSRLGELEAERQLHALPPVVVGGALVVPAGLLARPGNEEALVRTSFAVETKAVEERAMRAVLEWEAKLGRQAEAMVHNNPGFDIRSLDGDGHLLLIEVKGRITGADVVMVTRNEVLTGLNAAERYVLAMVEVRPDGTEEVHYLRDPFAGKSRQLHFAERATTFGWRPLWDLGTEPN